MIWRRLGWAFVVWSGFGAFSELCMAMYRAALDRPTHFAGPWDTMSSVWIWAAFTPAIMALARRFPVDRGRRGRHLAIHAASAVAASVLDVCFDALLGFGGPNLLAAFWEQLVINLFSYVAVVAVAYTVDYRGLYNERRLRALELEAQLARAQLRALELQLQPHFLFNTLHGIGGLIRTQQHAKAVRMLAGLGELLRLTLRREGHNEVPLRDELDVIDRYLAIERIRFGERLRVVVDVDPDALDTPVPSLILQPLVENAVVHGLGDDVADVEISVRMDAESLHLRVRDSGRGRPASPAGHGVGLANTRARLDQLYGNRQRLDLVSRPEGGTDVTVAIPRPRTTAASL